MTIILINKMKSIKSIITIKSKKKIKIKMIKFQILSHRNQSMKTKILSKIKKFNQIRLKTLKKFKIIELMSK